MFDGFDDSMVDVGPATAPISLRVRHGGSGPAVLLAHGHPAPAQRGTRWPADLVRLMEISATRRTPWPVTTVGPTSR